MKILVVIVLLVFSVVLSAAASEGDSPDNKQRSGKRGLGLLFGGRPRCPVARPVCPYDCGQDPAVVHGYCCGCGGPFDYAPISCPNWLQCPLRPEPLCSDYRFVMDCCCGAGVAFPFFK